MKHVPPGRQTFIYFKISFLYVSETCPYGAYAALL